MSATSIIFDPAILYNLYFRINRDGVPQTIIFSGLTNVNTKTWQLNIYASESAADGTPLLQFLSGSGLTLATDRITISPTQAQTASILAGEYYWQLYNVTDKQTWINGRAYFHKGEFDNTATSGADTITITVTGIPEAPTDGQQYARQNAAWAVSSSIGLTNVAFNSALLFTKNREMFQTGGAVTFSLAAGTHVNGAINIVRLDQPASVAFPPEWIKEEVSQNIELTKLNLITFQYFTNWNGTGTPAVIYGVKVYPTLQTSFDVAYQAWLDRNTFLNHALPPAGVQIAQNNFVAALRVNGLLARAKRFLFTHSGDKYTCLVDLIDPVNNTATMPVEYDFFEGWGIRCGERNGYMNQAFKGDSYAGIHTDLTLVTLITAMPVLDTRASQTFAYGQRTTNAGQVFAYYPFYDNDPGTDEAYAYHSSGAQAVAATKHSGLHVITYNGTQIVTYRDGVKTATAITPATPDRSVNRFILNLNNANVDNGSTPVPTSYNRPIALDILFDRFTDADELALRTAVNNYITAVGLATSSMMSATSLTGLGTPVTVFTRFASHCWFARPVAIYNATANRSWIGQVHNDGTGYTQWIFQLDHASGVTTKFKVGSFVEFDDHNEPSILVKQDGKLFTCYTEHARVGSPIRYRTSTNVRDGSAWGAESTVDPSSGAKEYTYCSCFQVANGDIYIFYRETDVSNADWAFIKSTDNGATFGAKTTFNSQTYTNIFQDPANADILHFVTSDHPNDNFSPNYICHFYFNAGAGTWHNSAGTNITSSLPLSQPNSTVIMTNTNPAQTWIQDIIVDGSGRPRVLFSYIPNWTGAPNQKYLYYSEWNGSAWTTPHSIHEVMNRNISSENYVGTGINLYALNACFDRNNPDRIFACKNVGTVGQLFVVTRNTASSFTEVQRTSSVDVDNWRPICTTAPNRNLFWLAKVYYGDYKGISATDFGYYQELMNTTI